MNRSVQTQTSAQMLKLAATNIGQIKTPRGASLPSELHLSSELTDLRTENYYQQAMATALADFRSELENKLEETNKKIKEEKEKLNQLKVNNLLTSTRNKPLNSKSSVFKDERKKLEEDESSIDDSDLSEYNFARKQDEECDNLNFMGDNLTQIFSGLKESLDVNTNSKISIKRDYKLTKNLNLTTWFDRLNSELLSYN